MRPDAESAPLPIHGPPLSKRVAVTPMPLLDHLNETYFDGRLSPAVRGLMAPIGDEREEVQRFVERMCRQSSGCAGT